MASRLTLTHAHGPSQIAGRGIGSAFLSIAQTKTLLSGSADFRKARLQEVDLLTTDEVAKLLDTSRVTVNKWIKLGRAIGLTPPTRGHRLPKWQFDQPIWGAIEPLAHKLGTTNGWEILAFMESPHGGLDGKTPRQAIEQGNMERVLKLAESN